jgi:succinate dehydrogenase iron-sulfur subunit
MKITLEIQRFDPEKDAAPHMVSYQVEAEPTDLVLDALHEVLWHQDGTLAFRRSCGHGVCGSDAMEINGVNRLACKVLVKSLGSKITVRPLRGLKVLRDLIVDMESFFDKYRRMKPWLITQGEEPVKERLQSPRQRAIFDDTTKCILCAACTSSCPSFWANDEYVGPAAIVAAHRFIFDSRDEATQERLELTNEKTGVWRCRTVFNCVEACPRDIDVTRAIGDIKRAILYNKT